MSFWPIESGFGFAWQIGQIGGGGTPSKISAFFLGLYILSFWPTESGFGFAWQIGGTPSRILANRGLRKAYCPEEQSLHFKQLVIYGIDSRLPKCAVCPRPHHLHYNIDCGHVPLRGCFSCSTYLTLLLKNLLHGTTKQWKLVLIYHCSYDKFGPLLTFFRINDYALFSILSHNCLSKSTRSKPTSFR